MNYELRGIAMKTGIHKTESEVYWEFGTRNINLVSVS